MHLNQVHKETLQHVENALPNRQGLDVEIFGMEGIPQDILDQHRNRIIQNFYQAQEDRRIATGNPLPGQSGQNTRKKIKMETKEELLARLREWRAMKKAEREAAANGVETAVHGGQTQSVRFPLTDLDTQTSVADNPYLGHPQLPQQGFEPPGHLRQPSHGQPPYLYPANVLPPGAPGPLGPPPGLPQRPSEGFSGAQAPDAEGEDIDKMIRMAEAGVKTAKRPDEAGDGEKKSKEKKGRLVYDDAEVSPEEKIARMARYAFGQEAIAA